MALNPFFLQGSPGEQRLIQDLINEQLKIYGVEVSYIPRKLVRVDNIFREVSSSKFDESFSIEAYVSNFEGYGGSGDILTKFGMSLRDELTLIISRERFETFISPFLKGMDQNEINVSSRPREGDLIYFPLGKRIFEVKFVEHEQPFYQLGNTYVYELKCELFEYEDEVGGFSDNNTVIEELDETLKKEGYITTLQLFASGEQASASTSLVSGYVRRVIVTNDGYGYVGIPTVSFTPAPVGGVTATGEVTTVCKSGVCSIKDILLVNPGSGYTVAPSVTIYSNGSGIGAEAYTEIITDYNGLGPFTITNSGGGYSGINTTITIPSPSVGAAITARAQCIVGSGGTISKVLIEDAGVGYGSTPSVIISNPPLLTGIGTYQFNEIVTGSNSGTTSRVKNWDQDTKVLQVGVISGDFYPGEIIVGSASSATYSLNYIVNQKFTDKYEQNDEIELEANLILDFSEDNPFGNY